MEWLVYDAVVVGSTTIHYQLAGRPVGYAVDGDLTYTFSDQLGSVASTYHVATGTIDQQYYYPFGEVRSTDGLGTDLGFTGQRADAATGLMYYNTRYYDPVLRRFTQADTIVPDFANPQDLKRYSYVRNNPVRYTDPTGHVVCALECGAGEEEARRGSGSSVDGSGTVAKLVPLIATPGAAATARLQAQADELARQAEAMFKRAAEVRALARSRFFSLRWPSAWRLWSQSTSLRTDAASTASESATKAGRASNVARAVKGLGVLMLVAEMSVDWHETNSQRRGDSLTKGGMQAVYSSNDIAGVVEGSLVSAWTLAKCAGTCAKSAFAAGVAVANTTSGGLDGLAEYAYETASKPEESVFFEFGGGLVDAWTSVTSWFGGD